MNEFWCTVCGQQHASTACKPVQMGGAAGKSPEEVRCDCWAHCHPLNVKLDAALLQISELRERLVNVKWETQDELFAYWKEGFAKHGYHLHPGLSPEQTAAEWKASTDRLNDEVRKRLSQVVNSKCSCGGMGPGACGCEWCEAYHFILGNTEKRVVNTPNGCRADCLCRKVADPNHGCSCHPEIRKCECVCGHDWENHEDPGGECVVTTLKDGKVGTYCQCGKFTEKQA